MRNAKERPKLRLKNGSTVDAQTAYLTWRTLEAMAKQDLHEYKTFRTLAEGDAPLDARMATAELIRRNRFFFDADGGLDPIARDVILSTKIDDESSRLSNPFELATENDARIISQVEAAIFSRLMDVFAGEERGPRR